MRIEVRLDHDVLPVCTEVEGCVMATIVQIDRLLDDQRLAGYFVQPWQRFQLVTVPLHLVLRLFRRYVIDTNVDGATSDGRVLRGVEIPVWQSVEIRADAETLRDQLQIVEIRGGDTLAHDQVLRTVFVEVDLERTLVAQIVLLVFGHVDPVVVGQVRVLLLAVVHVTVESVGRLRSTEQVHDHVVDAVNPVVVKRYRRQIRLHVEDELRPVVPLSLVEESG